MKSHAQKHQEKEHSDHKSKTSHHSKPPPIDKNSLHLNLPQSHIKKQHNGILISESSLSSESSDPFIFDDNLSQYRNQKQVHSARVDPELRYPIPIQIKKTHKEKESISRNAKSFRNHLSETVLSLNPHSKDTLISQNINNRHSHRVCQTARPFNASNHRRQSDDSAIRYRKSDFENLHKSTHENTHCSYIPHHFSQSIPSLGLLEQIQQLNRMFLGDNLEDSYKFSSNDLSTSLICSMCKKSINTSCDDGVFVGGYLYHINCMKCHACKKLMIPPFYIEKSSKLFCHECWIKRKRNVKKV